MTFILDPSEIGSAFHGAGRINPAYHVRGRHGYSGYLIHFPDENE